VFLLQSYVYYLLIFNDLFEKVGIIPENILFAKIHTENVLLFIISSKTILSGFVEGYWDFRIAISLSYVEFWNIKTQAVHL